MARELPDVEVVDVFVVDEHGRLRSPPVDVAGPTELRTAGHTAVRHLKTVKATPGHRLGTDPTVVVRTGRGEEISQPVLLSADAVLDRLDDPDLLADLPALDVDVDSVARRGAAVQWRTHLAVGRPSAPRPAMLQIRPTPAGNVSIIELVPERPRRFGTRTFVRVGVPAIAELGARLRAA